MLPQQRESQGACARSMCAVLCRTWLPKSKAELVGRGFDIGVASSSSSLPLPTRSVGRSVGRGMMSALYTTPSVRSSPSLLCQTSCSLARWDRPFTHSSSSRDAAWSATRPSSLHSILCHAVTTYNKGQSKERARESASVAANEEASSKWSASECGAMGDAAASSPSHLNNNRARG